MAKLPKTKLSRKQFEVLMGRVLDREQGTSQQNPVVPPVMTMPPMMQQQAPPVDMSQMVQQMLMMAPTETEDPNLNVPGHMAPIPAGEPPALDASPTPLNGQIGMAQELWTSLGPMGQRLFEMLYNDNLRSKYPDAETAFIAEVAKIASGEKASDDEADEFIRAIMAQQPEPIVPTAGRMSDIKTSLLNAFNAPASGGADGIA